MRMCASALGGADFEIVSTHRKSTYEKAHFVFPHVLAAASMAGKLNRESQKQSSQSCGIKTRQASHLSNPEGAVGELYGDASSPASASVTVAFREWRLGASAKSVPVFKFFSASAKNFQNFLCQNFG